MQKINNKQNILNTSGGKGLKNDFSRRRRKGLIYF